MAAPTTAALLAPLERLGMRFDLGPTRLLLAAVGDPAAGLPCALVGGTNGKGSTAAFLAAIATAGGYRTGLYTSPHLEEPRERVRIDGRALADGELANLVAEVLRAAGGQPPTYFEALTVAALLAFRRHRVDLAVLEVGLGGRLDATNATDPLLSLICEIGLDHAEILGPTLEEVAGEKAGIFRRGRPAIAAPAPPEATAALERAAAETGAELVWLERPTLPAGPLPLAGAHQQRNAALAAAGARRLRAAGFPLLDEDAIAAGLRGCRWPGRLETVAPPGRPPILLDGAHNPQAAAALRRALPAAERPSLLFGALADKDAASMLAILRPAVGEVYLAPPASPRALSIADLLALPGASGARAFPTAAEALDTALAAGVPLLVTGSIFLVGEVRALLRARFGEPPPAAEVATYAPARAGSRE